MRKLIFAGLAGLVLTSCAGHPTTGSTAPPEAGMPLNMLSAKDVADTIKKAGVSMPNAHDVTAVKCAQLQCIGAIDSDTVSIAKFQQSGPAERYAGDTSNSYVVEDIVLVFAPAVPPADRVSCERAVERAAQK